MCTPYRCDSHATQLYHGEMVPLIPRRGWPLYPEVDANDDDFCSTESVEDDHTYSNGFSTGLYQILAPQNESWNLTQSSDPFPNTSMLESGFDHGFPALNGNTESILSFSGSSNFALPLKSRPLVSQEYTQDCETTIVTEKLPSNRNTSVAASQALVNHSVDPNGWSDSDLRTGDFAVSNLGPPQAGKCYGLLSWPLRDIG
jgi:hypothetical protein